MRISFFGYSSRPVPLIMQSEMTECGLACLAMLGNYHGHEVNIAGLRKKYPSLSRGSSLKQLMKIAQDLHLTCRPLKLELEHLKDLQLPCLLHWDLNHFVVMVTYNSKAITVNDPGFGVRTLSHSEFAEHFTGIAMELKPAKTFKRIEAKSRLKLSSILRSLDLKSAGLAQVLALSFAILILTISLPFFTQLVFDEVIYNFDEQLLLLLALAMAASTAFRAIFTVLRGYLILFVGNLLSSQIGAAIFNHLTHLPMRFFASRHIGDIISRFSSFESVKRFLTEGMVEVAIDGFMGVLTLVLMMVYSLKLGLISLAFTCLYLAFRMLLFRPFKELTEDSIVSYSKEQSNFMETVRGIQSIKLYGGQAQRQGLWQNLYIQTLNKNTGLGRFRVKFLGAKELLFGLERSLIIYLGVRAIFSQELSPGMLIAFLSFKDQFTEKFSLLLENGFQYKMLSLHLDRVADILLEDTESIESGGDGDEEIEGRFQLEGISHRHDDHSPQLLQSLNLDASAGEHIAVVGPSGVGKTTLLKIMVGLLKPTEGGVRVDGKLISTLGRRFQDSIATVMQDDHLLSGSILENIAFFDPNPDLQRIESCARLACIYEDIVKMPMNFHTMIGDMGSSLSGGQKQRLLLARAFYRQPKILFLDEATSHLDEETESAINENIRRLRMTKIVIAHRRETILSADRILLLQGGMLHPIEKGDFMSFHSRACANAR